ncbi:MAG: ATP-dependent DNA helicase [Deltaproteobacteria bacterium]|nr:ATP-dependent DNA helicase [Deltaproteobacteria bacterium]MBW2047399.1 ATP-dependent DNA helicase [Deltaproteobacteria bacterium]MBW2110433.1 ATP-dependent DNA helicase [Deltaproteobacteria bacterium]HDZ90539.1 ATP-dependent DNA helicase [Deltaproteobacteria bacterium]
MPTPYPTVEDVLRAGGILARSLKNFEFRPSQLRMALLIEEAIKGEKPALIEAGTGTGKTFGYLVPVILSNKKSVISTGTKNLQEQIYLKDIPLLNRTAGLKTDSVMMKGRENYLCLHKYHQYISQTTLLKTTRAENIDRLRQWLIKTEFADRGEIPWLGDDDTLWNLLSSSSEQCLGSECPDLDRCFLGRLRARAAKARIIIVNHHLFFADMKVKRGGFGEIIPRFQVAVFDEAHTVEGIATSYLGESISTRQITDLTADLKRETARTRGAEKGPMKRGIDSIQAGIGLLRGAFEKGEEKGRLNQKALADLGKGPVGQVRRGLRSIYENPDLARLKSPPVQVLLDRAREMHDLLEEILRHRGENWLNWFERRKKTLILHSSPLDISGWMTELLYQKVRTVVFTSATLATNGSFDYIRSRLGLPHRTLQEICPSHFHFETQTLLYIPRGLPSPASPHFGSRAAEEVLEILKRTDGRGLVLFTSYHNLSVVHQTLKDRLPFTIYRQGQAPRSVLLDSFRRDLHSVLFATGSFWQGVDVPGEALSCLIIDKLPFESPGEPIVGARIDSIRSRGGNPFMEYQIPSAIITLKQGLGRLIRKGSDRGILAVLDVRIMTSRYGRFFLESLPNIPLTHDLSDIGRFFSRGASGVRPLENGSWKNRTGPNHPRPS